MGPERERPAAAARWWRSWSSSPSPSGSVVGTTAGRRFARGCSAPGRSTRGHSEPCPKSRSGCWPSPRSATRRGWSSASARPGRSSGSGWSARSTAPSFSRAEPDVRAAGVRTWARSAGCGWAISRRSPPRAVTTWRPPGSGAIPSRSGRRCSTTRCARSSAPSTFSAPSPPSSLPTPRGRGFTRATPRSPLPACAADGTTPATSPSTAPRSTPLSSGSCSPRPTSRRSTTIGTSPSRATGFRTCSTRRVGVWSGSSRCRTAAAASGTPPARSTTGATARTCRTGCLLPERRGGDPGHRPGRREPGHRSRPLPLSRPGLLRPGAGRGLARTALPRCEPGDHRRPHLPRLSRGRQRRAGARGPHLRRGGDAARNGRAPLPRGLRPLLHSRGHRPELPEGAGLRGASLPPSSRGRPRPEGHAPGAACQTRRAHPGRRRPRRLSAERADLLGLPGGGLRPHRLLRHSPLPRRSPGGRRRLRAGAGQRPPPPRTEPAPLRLRERPARRFPRTASRLPPLAGRAAGRALPPSRASWPAGRTPHRSPATPRTPLPAPSPSGATGETLPSPATR